MNLRTELMSHQIPAVEKMLHTTIGGLFMDMGTGKTRTTFELVYRRLSKIDKVVYFCPVSLKETVRQEILEHTTCTESDIYVFGDKTNDRTLPKALWYIIGIESMSSSTRMVLAANKLITSKTFVILDESSYIKGHDSKRTTRITAMSARSRYRLILTGTPLSQGVDIIEWVCKNEDYTCIGDLCMGRGLVGISAHKNGKKFVGTELNHKRLSVLLEKLANDEFMYTLKEVQK